MSISTVPARTFGGQHHEQLPTNEDTEMITRDFVKEWSETGLNGQRDVTSGYNTLQKRGVKQAKFCGSSKRILIRFHGGIQREGGKSVSRTAVASGKNKVRAIYS